MKANAIVLSCALAVSACGIPYRAEYDAYSAYIQSEVTAGRVSSSQADYMTALKENELRARSANAINTGIVNAYPGVGLAIQGSQRQHVPGVTCVQTGAIVTCR